MIGSGGIGKWDCLVRKHFLQVSWLYLIYFSKWLQFFPKKFCTLKIWNWESQGLLLDQTGIWKKADVRHQSWAGINVSLPVLLLLCFFHAVAEALPPLIFLLPAIPLLLTFELCTERWETWACLPGRLTKAAAATALCSWEEEEKECGTPLTPTDETLPWDSWPWELWRELERGFWVTVAWTAQVFL